MSTLLEQLVGAKALIESAIEQEMARNEPPPPEKATSDCAHKNRQNIVGAGPNRPRIACVDCGEEWETDDAS